MEDEKRFPRRAKAHVTGDIGVREFLTQIPPEWTDVNSGKSDYGWDFHITVFTEERPLEFSVQVKSSESPDYIESGNQISISLEVTTVNFLKQRPIPTLIAICDTSKVEKPIYWVWINDALEELEGRNPSWSSQETVNLRAPTSRTIADSSEDIVRYVAEVDEERRINQEIRTVLGSDTRSWKLEKGESRTPRALVRQDFVPRLERAGIVEIITEADDEEITTLSEADQARFEKIKQISSFLNDFRDSDAQTLLQELEEEIGSASDGIKARYFNNLGVLEQHNHNDEEASKQFQVAQALRPNDPKYLVNSLATTLLAALDKDPDSFALPTDWEEKLEFVLQKNPKDLSAIRLKAVYIAKSDSPEASVSYLKSSPVYEEEKVLLTLSMAEILNKVGLTDRAIEVLEDIDVSKDVEDGQHLALTAFVHFRKALETDGKEASNRIDGPGPPGLDVNHLEIALGLYERSFRWFMSREFPTQSESCAVNLACIYMLLNDFDAVIETAKLFIRYRPDSFSLREYLASGLFLSGRYFDAIQQIQKIIEAGPPSPILYEKYVFALFMAEDYEELLKVASKRERDGFKSLREEAYSRMFVAIAFHDMGEEDKSVEQIEKLTKNPAHSVEAGLARIEIEERKGASKGKIIEEFKKLVKKHPKNVNLASSLAGRLNPYEKSDASDVIALLEGVMSVRGLAPEEYSALTNAYITMDGVKKAKETIEKGLKRYPRETRFYHELGHCFFKEGDENTALLYLETYLQHGHPDFNVLRDVANVAFLTGRLDDSIKMYHRALSKAKNERDKARIHEQLFLLKRVQGKAGVELLSHAAGMGRGTESIEEEVRYLMCFLTTPSVPGEEKTAEAEGWVSEFQERLKTFVDKNPRYGGLTAISIPEGLTPEETLNHLEAELTALTLPAFFASTPLEISSRSEVWPLSFRANFLPKGGSFFEFWEKCTKANSNTYGIHIWRDINPLEEEHRTAIEAREVVIDLTVLMTLHEVGLLDIIPKLFRKVYITNGTQMTLLQGAHDPFTQSQSAKNIRTWVNKNRNIVRVQVAVEPESEKLEYGGYKKGPAGLYLPYKEQIGNLIGDGVGESLQLAKKLGLPLYSDECSIRKFAAEEGVSSFSTLSLLNRMKAEESITVLAESGYIAELLKKNFRVIPINSEHLTIGVKALIESGKAGNIKSDDLQKDKIIGELLRQFGNKSFELLWRILLAISWWIAILSDDEISGDMLIETMRYPIHCFVMGIEGSVIAGIKTDEPKELVTAISALFLWRAFRADAKIVIGAWSSIKEYCRDQYEERAEEVLYGPLQRWLIHFIGNEDLSDEEKTEALVLLPIGFPADERIRFEEACQGVGIPFNH